MAEQSIYVQSLEEFIDISHFFYLLLVYAIHGSVLTWWFLFFVSIQSCLWRHQHQVAALPQSLNLNCPWCSVPTLSLYKFYWGSVIPEHNQTMIANLNKCIIILIVAFIQKHVKDVVHHLLHKPPAELIPLIPLILFFFINLYNFNMCAAREKKWQTINCKATWDSLKLTQKTWIV